MAESSRVDLAQEHRRDKKKKTNINSRKTKKLCQKQTAIIKDCTAQQ